MLARIQSTLLRLLPPAVTPAALERALQRRRITRDFHAALGYAGDFVNPRSYHEKMQFRKIYGNHEFYARVADKVAVRDYVRERIGAEYLKPLLGVYDRITPAILESLPRPYIVKANNGCKWHRIVRAGEPVDFKEIARYFARLRYRHYGRNTGELHYDYIPYKVLVEPLLQEDDGALPWDYDIWCFNTTAGFRYLVSLVSPYGAKAAFDDAWNCLQGEIDLEMLRGRLAPAEFPRMLAAARRLSAGFDFVRVDFNLVRGRIYFGEITCTPGQGYTLISSPRRLQLLTEWWQLDSLNRALYRAPRAHRHAHGAADVLGTRPLAPTAHR